MRAHIAHQAKHLCVGPPAEVQILLFIYMHMLKCQEKNEKYMCLGITAKLMCAAPSRFSQCFDPLFYLFYLLELKCGLGIRHSFCPASLSLELSQLCQCKHLLFSLLICAFRLTSLPSWLYWKHSRRAVSIRNGYHLLYWLSVQNFVLNVVVLQKVKLQKWS